MGGNVAGMSSADTSSDSRAARAPAGLPILRSAAAVLLVLCTLPLLSDTLGATLAFDRDAVANDAHWFRLASAYLSHWSVSHWATNMLALALLASIADHPPGLGTMLATAALCSLLLLFAMPDVLHYRGSSPLVAIFLPAAVLALWRRAGPGRPAAVLLAGAYAAKIVIDANAGGVSPFLPAGVRSTWELHLAGLACGALALARRHLSAGDRAGRRVDRETNNAA